MDRSQEVIFDTWGNLSVLFKTYSLYYYFVNNITNTIQRRELECLIIFYRQQTILEEVQLRS